MWPHAYQDLFQKEWNHRYKDLDLYFVKTMNLDCQMLEFICLVKRLFSFNTSIVAVRQQSFQLVLATQNARVGGNTQHEALTRMGLCSGGI